MAAPRKTAKKPSDKPVRAMVKREVWGPARNLKFARLLFEGKTSQREAFLEVAPAARKWKQSSQDSNASYRANLPEIVALVEKLRAEAIAKVVDAGAITLELHLKTLADLRDRAAIAGDWGSAVRAEEDRGKAGGLYIERKQVDSRALVTHEHRAVRAVDALMADALQLGGTGGDPAVDGEERPVLPDPLPVEAQRH